MEDALWKSLYEKIQAAEKPAACQEHRLQELDGGFFEKFGTLLQEQAKKDDEDSRNGSDEPYDGVEGTEEEAEDEKKEKRGDLISDIVGLNMDELYEAVIYEILHIVGADSSVNQSSLFEYVKDVFKIDDEKHNSTLKEAKTKQAPNVMLNVEVMEAKDLSPKDANGFSDPFCTLFLVSKPTHRYNTSVQTQTLNPQWEEYFSLSIDNPSEDILSLEVWDFDPAETVKEKVSKISEVKNVRGLRKLMKEIAVTGVTGKQNNEIIGCINIPLKCIPSYGHVKWYTLEKKNKIRGEIKLKMTFGSEKNSQVAFQEGRHLIRLLLLHEIEANNIDPKTWNGEFPEPANTVLRQHAAHSGLRPADECMGRWLEFTRFHTSQTLNYSLFESVLGHMNDPLKNGLYSDEEVKLFWDGVKRILPWGIQYVRKLRKSYQDDKACMETLTAILKVILCLLTLEKSDSYDLFPKSLYEWLQLDEKTRPLLLDVVKETIKQSAVEWFDQVVGSTKPTESSNEKILEHCLKVTQHVRNDLQRSLDSFNKVFYTILEVRHTVILYQVYDIKVTNLVEPCVLEVCSVMKHIDIDNNSFVNDEENALTTGTTLFELYLLLKKYVLLGQAIIPDDVTQLKIFQFHTWFQRAVAHWLNIAVYKAITRIGKAIEIDKLVPMDETVKHSSSAVDTLEIFYQIQIFWIQLSWPDIEGTYTFVAKIIDDICRCCVYYAEEMGKRVETNGETNSSYGKKFEVTNEWCLAINNIHYISQAIERLVVQLGVDEILQKLTESRNEIEVQQCKKTIRLVVDNAIENVCNKIIDLLNIMAFKMCPVVKRFLLEGGEIINQGNNHIDELMRYLDDNLTTLNTQLNKDNFDKILLILWREVYEVLNELIQDSIEKKRPSSFFANMEAALEILVGFFKQSENLKNDDSYKQIKQVLTFHGMGTDELIHCYYLDRLKEQKEISDPSNGMLTIRAQFVNCTLRIEILNARNLIATDRNGSSDPYVKIHFLPSEKFADIIKPKTKTHKKNLFPLFDETFTIQFNKEQKEFPNALVHFVVKDQEFISSQFLAEAFLPFYDIPNTTLETSLQKLPQVHLKLSKPPNKESDTLKALDHRQGEKLARDFVKRQRTRMVCGTDDWFV